MPVTVTERLYDAAGLALRAWIYRRRARVDRLVVDANDIYDPGGYKALAQTAGPGNYAELADAFVGDEDLDRVVRDLEALQLTGPEALRVLSRWDDMRGTFAEAGVRRKRPTIAFVAAQLGYVPHKDRS